MSTLIANYDGNFNGRAITLRLEVWLNSQNISGNTSRVDWTLRAFEYQSEIAFSSNASAWHVDIGGQHWRGNWTYNFGTTDNMIIATGWRDITHNADGTVSFWAGADAQASGLIGNAINGGQTSLPVIPRASVPTTSVGSIDAGQPFTIFTNRASTNFTHTVKYSFGAAQNVQIATNVGASVSFTPPLSILTNIPNLTQAGMRIFVDTYNGNTFIGSSSTLLNITVPASVVPTIGSVTATEGTSGVATAIGAFVQGQSKLNVGIVGAQGAQGSTITAQKITVAGQTINAATGLTSPITTSGTVPVVATVTDSRGRTASKTLNVTVLPYTAPTLTNVLLQRATSAGAIDESGTYIRTAFTAAVASLTVNSVQKNSLVYKISTRPRGTTVWTLKKTVTATGLAFNSFDLVGTFPIESATEVLIGVSDKLTTSSVQGTVATTSVFMHWGDRTQGLGIGKFWERGGMDVLGQIYQNDGLAVLDLGSLATNAETITGTSTVKAVSPAGLTARLGITAAWQTPTMLNSWQMFNTSRFRVVNGICYLYGWFNKLNNGSYATGEILFQLPAGYRPIDGPVPITGFFSGTARQVNILNDGNVKMDSAGTGGVVFSTAFPIS